MEKELRQLVKAAKPAILKLDFYWCVDKYTGPEADIALELMRCVEEAEKVLDEKDDGI